MKMTSRKPTPLEIIMHKAMMFGKTYGVEPVSSSTYIRTLNLNKTDIMVEKAIAPWEDLQVLRLELRQLDRLQHPYTCPNGTSLKPTESGWVCSCCTYQQDWARLSDVENTYSTIGLKPIDRIYNSIDSHNFLEKVAQVLKIKTDDEKDLAAILEVVTKLAVYEPAILKLLPSNNKKED